MEMGLFMHAAEGEMVCKSTNEKVPYFNAPIFLENKTPIGKVDEIFGPTTEMVRACMHACIEGPGNGKGEGGSAQGSGEGAS